MPYSKSPTHKLSSCKLSKMRTCVHMSNHVSEFTCLAYIVTCMHPLQVVVLLCTLLYSTISSTVVQYLYFKLDLQEDDFIQLLAVQHEELTNEDLIELEAHRTDEERQKEKK